MESTENNGKLHTEEIELIISRKPLWIYKWGILVIIAIMVFCFVIAAFVKLPQISSLKLKIAYVQTPTEVISPGSGEIVSLTVRNNQIVKKGFVLAMINRNKIITPVIATDSGVARYIGIIHINQFVKTGQMLFEIQQNSGNYYGVMPVPKSIHMDLRPGQKLFIKLDDYPYQKYGVIGGNIKYIAIDTTDKNRFITEVSIAKIKRPDIVLTDDMTGTADIVISETTLLRLFLNSVFKNKISY